MGIVNVSSTETKWTWLQKRLAGAQAEVDALAGQLQGLENTPYDGQCMTCGHYMETEADFAKHYIVRDPRYLNLGECPTKFVNGVNKHQFTSDGPKMPEGKTYFDVLGPMKNILHPDGI